MRFLAIALLFMSSVPSAFQSENLKDLDEWHKGPIKWIISENETEQFESLASDEERLDFIKRFWERRDPTPNTSTNEYKDEFYSRVEFANQNFREGIPGWRTDRGRILIIHGPPDQQQYDSRPRGEGFGANHGSNTILWTYFSLPTAKFFKGRMSLVFQPNVGMTEQDVTLGESQMARTQARNLWNRGGARFDDMDLAVQYRLVAAGPPAAFSGRGVGRPASGIGDYARHVEDLFRSPGDLLDEWEEENVRQESSRLDLREQIKTAVTFNSLPVYMTAQEFYGNKGATVTVNWQVPLSALNFTKKDSGYEGKIDLITQVTDKSGQLIDEFFKSFTLIYSEDEFEQKKTQDFRYVNEFHLPAGTYRVTTVIRDIESESLGSSTQEIRCVYLSEASLTMSGLVLSRTSQAVQEDSILPADLRFSSTDQGDEDWLIIPESDLAFSRDEKMMVYFKLYNSKVNEDGVSSVVVSYRFLQDDSVVKKTNPRAVGHLIDEKGVITYGSMIELDDLKPGIYSLQVNAIDFASKSYAIKRTDFTIE